MKLKALVIASFMILSSSAFAQWWIQPQMFVTPDAVVAKIVNIWGRPVICQGEVHGLTAHGRWLANGFRDIVPMGQFRQVVVVTNPYFDPFVDGRPFLWCNYL